MVDDPFLAPRKLTHEQARIEQLVYWSKKTPAERLAAMTALNKRLLGIRGIELMESDQISLLVALLAAHVDYGVVGGVAVNAYGYLRATQDLDVFIRPTEENARAAFAALRTFGLALEGLEPSDLLNDEENLRFGPIENHVDILASIGEMPFDQVWHNRVLTQIHGHAIPFISKADLIENKRQTGRLRDLADIEELSRLPDNHPTP